MRMSGRPPALAIGLLAGALASGACAGCSAPDAHSAAEVASRFHASVAAGDGRAACRLLAPVTARHLAADAQSDCSAAITQADIPPTRSVIRSEAFGRSAQAILDGDVVFLTQVDRRWRVTAAGCTAVAGQPYDCIVEGG